MGITAPDNIPFPDAGTALPPLETHFAALAEGAQQALNSLRASATAPVANAAGRNNLYPSPVQGNAVWRLDLGYEERYFSEYSASGNPGGATPAGWYPTGGNTPAAFGIKTANQTFNSGAGTLITFDTLDAHGGMTVTASSTFTVPVTGWYRLSIKIGSFSGNGGADRWLYATLNTTSASNPIISNNTAGTTATFGILSFSVAYPLVAGDVIRYFSLQNSGVAYTLNNAQAAVEFISPRT